MIRKLDYIDVLLVKQLYEENLDLQLSLGRREHIER